MSPTQTMISVEEYLSTMYRPDCDFVDGLIQERNMGEKPHARLQAFFIAFLMPFEDEFSFEVLPEQRLQTQPTHFRIPDVMIVPFPSPDPLIIRSAPLALHRNSFQQRPTKRYSGTRRRVRPYGVSCLMGSRSVAAHSLCRRP